MTEEAKKERIAKVIARAGICSRREAERLIAEGKVSLNGKVLDTPAYRARKQAVCPRGQLGSISQGTTLNQAEHNIATALY